MKIGLFFGSFNPIHIGHLAIANYMVEFSNLDKIWFVISPLSPFKKKSNLLADYHRYRLVSDAIEDDLRFKACDIEFNMPKPSYTIDTLAYLKEKYTNKEFSLIMGADNIINFHKWKNYDEILKHHKIFIYPRPDIDISEYDKSEKINIINAPLIEISASFIRNSIKDNKDVRYFMHPKVYSYIDEMNFYR